MYRTLEHSRERLCVQLKNKTRGRSLWKTERGVLLSQQGDKARWMVLSSFFHSFVCIYVHLCVEIGINLWSLYSDAAYLALFIHSFILFVHLFIETGSHFIALTVVPHPLDRALFYSSGWPWTQRDPLASFSWVLELKMCITKLGHHVLFFVFLFFFFGFESCQLG